jgi:KUP system potassium uptake protein
MLTPAITVLSAMEGLTVTMPFVEPCVMPLTLVIVTVLFLVQPRGTARVGAVFGPVILLWFVTIGILGLVNILDHPSVLAAISPPFALDFFALNGMRAFVIMGTVFLLVTGGEAYMRIWGTSAPGRSAMRGSPWCCPVCCSTTSGKGPCY